MNVIVLRTTEDGDYSLDVMTAEALERKLNEQWYGENPVFLDPTVPGFNIECAVGLIVFTGFIVPKPAQTVTQWRLPR